MKKYLVHNGADYKVVRESVFCYYVYYNNKLTRVWKFTTGHKKSFWSVLEKNN